MVLTLAWSGATWWIVPLVSSNAAWDSTAASGARALTAARDDRGSSTDSVAFARHEQLLREGQLRSRQSGFFLRRVALAFGISALLAFLGLIVIASRVAGHLSRNLSRPLQELVGWTERIARGEGVPDEPAAKGAPEFAMLRGRMREMSLELDKGRRAALEAERGAAMRETARQVAHELKNPLTPIRFAVERLRRDAPANLQESIEVLQVESSRLEELARSFAQFGRLPEGPRAAVDVGELARYSARSSVPQHVPVEVRVADDVPMVEGHHEALARALSNVMLNAVEACKDGGSISVDVRRVNGSGRDAVTLEVRDTGCGIPASRLARIWDPYV